MSYNNGLDRFPEPTEEELNTEYVSIPSAESYNRKLRDKMNKAKNKNYSDMYSEWYAKETDPWPNNSRQHALKMFARKYGYPRPDHLTELNQWPPRWNEWDKDCYGLIWYTRQLNNIGCNTRIHRHEWEERKAHLKEMGKLDELYNIYFEEKRTHEQ